MGQQIRRRRKKKQLPHFRLILHWADFNSHIQITPEISAYI